MTIDRALTEYTNEIKASEIQRDTAGKQARHKHDTAVNKAKGTYDLAVRAADTALEKALNGNEAMAAFAVDAAELKFDAAVCVALGVPDRAFIRTVVGGRLELWFEGGMAPVAEASKNGPAGWALDGAPGGRQWLGPAGEPTARIGLWRIAVALTNAGQR